MSDVATKLERIIGEFADFEPRERLELLLDFANNLPPLPERLRAERDAVRTGQRPPTPSRAIAPAVTQDDIRAMRQQTLTVRSLQDYYAGVEAGARVNG